MVNSTSLAVQFLQCEALLVTVTLKCYVFLTGKQVSSYSFSVFLANGPSTVSFLIGYSTVWGAVMHTVVSSQDVQEGGTEARG